MLQVVFWPSMMSTPDRDAISLSRLFRFHIVANGSPGAIHDMTGNLVPDLKTVDKTSSGWVVTGTMDVSEWPFGVQLPRPMLLLVRVHMTPGRGHIAAGCLMGAVSSG